ncbi:LPS assembly protein LptD [Montanilutibacter psychrotolerans]|uniref:LPS-assembly protein LptD n=1 Tax=Montanilutibacter psychrotolerans TaxID=1327343 RepID=A0A3M8SZ43_9GAMM|nr:LPS assembly protein LptD [Lysobacter psychrotolerans]RNF84170.1 LPS-assembly protein LptD [Lysobacter psychrotolerans]
MRNTLRLLPLPLCIAFALPAYAADDNDDWGLCPIEDAVPTFGDAPDPVGTPEQRIEQPTDIAGDALAGQKEDAVFQGNVALNRGDQFLGTDKLTFNQDTGKYVAEGNVRYQDSGMRIVANRASGDQNTDEHQIEDLRYQLTERRGNGGAERIELKGKQGALLGSTYSTCPPSQRAWELRAHRIDIDTEEGMGVARNAVLRVGKVPVLYVPWLMFPIDDRRRTGLLYPAIALSGRNGFDWKQPIYLNLAPNYDATLNPRYMSKRGAMLGGEFRWLYPQGNGLVSGNWMPDDKLPENDPDRYLNRPDGSPRPGATLPGSNRGQVLIRASHNFSRSWYARANLGWISDTHYLEDFSNSLYGISNYSVQSSVGLYGRGRGWDLGLMADHQRLTDYTLTEESLRYNRLPRAYANWTRTFGRWFETGINAEAVRFQHTSDLRNAAGFEVKGEGSRVDLKPYISMPLEGAAWFINPKLAWRYTAYQLDRGLATQLAQQQAQVIAGRAANGRPNPIPAGLVDSLYDDAPVRSLPISSLDAGLFFDRHTQIRGDSYLHTLEPRLYYLNVPYENQDDQPLFDTNDMTFSWGQLFRDNRYTGADRQTDAEQLTLAVTSRLISESDGRERLAASLGQIHYLEDSRVTTAPGGQIIEKGKSAWVAEVSVSPSDRWNIAATYQWDPKFRRQDLASLRARYLIGEAGVVNLSYRYRRDLTEQADFSFLYPINQNWSVVGRHYYSMLDHKPLETIAGVQWESCCLAVRLVGRRYLRNRTGELNNSLQVEFELKGLGSAGQNTERVLRRAILGYDRDDLYLVPPSSVTAGEADNSPDPTL